MKSKPTDIFGRIPHTNFLSAVVHIIYTWIGSRGMEGNCSFQILRYRLQSSIVIDWTQSMPILSRATPSAFPRALR